MKLIQHSNRFTTTTCGLLLFLVLWSSFALLGRAAEVDLKPGDTVGPHNWEKIKGMVGENFLNRVKQGYRFTIKTPTRYQAPKEYLQATKRYSGRVQLGPNGELINHVAGLPFPDIDPSDPRAGQKIAWNFYWRWQGDDFKGGGGTETGKMIRSSIEKDGSERRADFYSYFMFPRTRVSLEPKPVFPGYEHVDSLQLRVDSYPRDSSGGATLEIRYSDPKRPDDLYLYIPSLRRVRRLTTTQRCQTLAPSEFNLDDIDFFRGKITDFNYKLLGERKALTNYAQERVPYRRNHGDYLPLDEKFEIQDVYVLEITPKDAAYCYPKKVLWIDKTAWETTWGMTWDRRGDYWKEFVLFRIPARLPDSQIVWQQGTGYVINVQNGRSTVITASRQFNIGLSPDLFTFATLQSINRLGEIR
ncbi:MAG: DUF1329 domain-containing protein [Deltaproteobacteria bacterium]|nr:DUF1329 domain-containing protein [Deltaproteobacteria bacterium]